MGNVVRSELTHDITLTFPNVKHCGGGSFEMEWIQGLIPVSINWLEFAHLLNGRHPPPRHPITDILAGNSRQKEVSQGHTGEGRGVYLGDTIVRHTVPAKVTLPGYFGRGRGACYLERGFYPEG